MKLVSYRRDGALRHGRITDGDLVAELGDGDLGTLVETAFPLTPDSLPPTVGEHALGDVEVVTPIRRPGKLLAAAANYQDHVTETGGAPLDRSRLTPRLFLKPSTSIVGPGVPVAVPELSHEMDWEAELTVVIGRGGKDITVDAALDHVAGYCTSNDVSARSLDYGMERDTEGDSAHAVWFFDWLAGKWFDGFAPIGPYLVTADEIPDPQDLAVDLEVNGESRQHGSTKDMIFSTAELIAHASRLTTLEPGDMIMTGTPSGVGAASGTYLKAGDVMTVMVGPLGTLTTPVT